MIPRRGKPSGAERTAPTWVKALVGFHVVATTIWALPNPPEAVAAGKVPPVATQWLLVWNGKYLKAQSLVRSYLFVTGAWQYWDMFAPNPASMDWYCTALVEYKDGTKRIVEYPRMFKLDIGTKYVKERFRKFYERAKDDQKPNFWPTFAQTMALRAYTERDNPPVVVRLRRHWLQIEPPGKPQPKEYGSYEYFAYAVDQQLLKAGGL